MGSEREAAKADQRALQLTANLAEQRVIESRLAGLGATHPT